MQKTLFIIGLAAALAGCGGDDKKNNTEFGDYGSNGDNQTSKCKSADIIINSVGDKRTIDKSGATVSVCGFGNNIIISSDLNSLHVSGNGNNFYFADGIKIENCTIDGFGNTAKKANVSMTCSGSGVGNEGF